MASSRPSAPPARPTAECRLRALALGLVLTLAFGAPHARAQPGLRWSDGDRPGSRADEAIALLAGSADDGLDPADYGVETLRTAIADARRRAPAAPDARRLDEALTRALRRYLRDLHDGRVDPRTIHPDFAPPRRPRFDAAGVLDAALAAGRLRDAASRAAPPIPQYTRLREMLARYRALGGHPAWRRPLPALPPAGRRGAGKLEPGATWAGVPMLAERLAALGDLPAAGPPPAPGEAPATGALPATPATRIAALRYDDALVRAVRRFQHRHGLDADGIVGRETLARLEVTPRARARQIALAMERLRWTPLLQAPRMIVVNVPEFVLRAYEVQDGRITVRAEMKVVVGKSLDTRTPLIDAQMRYIEFSPYWNVPASIARKELVPLLRRRPERFAREGYEFVGADGRVDEVLTPARLDAVLAGQLRIRQRPGPANPLGDIKFAFPNRESIYLHHTPATALFARARRDFSHGCIRVENPVALARFVLAPQPEWTEERIRAAMSAGVSSTLPLVAPLPVLIAYGTAIVKEGGIFFFDDLYGHDLALDAALRARSTPRPDGRPATRSAPRPEALSPTQASTR